MSNALSDISDRQVYSKDHDVALMLLSDSVTGTLLIREADEIGANCYKPPSLRLQRRPDPCIYCLPRGAALCHCSLPRNGENVAERVIVCNRAIAARYAVNVSLLPACTCSMR